MKDGLDRIVGQEVAARHIDFHEMTTVLGESEYRGIGQERTSVELDL